MPTILRIGSYRFHFYSDELREPSHVHIETPRWGVQVLAIRTILTGKEFAFTGLQSEMLCVKLMGSLDIPDKQSGSMVLDTGDLALAHPLFLTPKISHILSLPLQKIQPERA